MLVRVGATRPFTCYVSWQWAKRKGDKMMRHYQVATGYASPHEPPCRVPSIAVLFNKHYPSSKQSTTQGHNKDAGCTKATLKTALAHSMVWSNCLARLTAPTKCRRAAQGR